MAHRERLVIDSCCDYGDGGIFLLLITQLDAGAASGSVVTMRQTQKCGLLVLELGPSAISHPSRISKKCWCQQIQHLEHFSQHCGLRGPSPQYFSLLVAASVEALPFIIQANKSRQREPRAGWKAMENFSSGCGISFAHLYFWSRLLFLGLFSLVLLHHETVLRQWVEIVPHGDTAPFFPEPQSASCPLLLSHIPRFCWHISALLEHKIRHKLLFSKRLSSLQFRCVLCAETI